jgi:DNA polymerase-3 subunit alpha
MMEVLEEALDYGQRVQREKNDPQMSLFDVAGTSQPAINAPRLPDMEEWDDFYRLTLEKETLGFYITGHPLKRHEAVLKKFTSVDALSIRETPNRNTVRLGGLIKAIKAIRTKKGDPMAFVTIEDMLGSVEVVVFSDLYAQVTDLLVEDQAVLVEGEVQVDEKAAKVLADTLIPIEKAEETWTAEICFTIDTEMVERDQLHRMHDLLRRHPGTCRAYMYIVIPDQSETIVQLPEHFRLAPSEALNREIKGLLGYDAVTTRCRSMQKTAAVNDYRRFRSNRT